MTNRVEGQNVRKTHRDELTEVERVTLDLVANGRTNEEIAHLTRRPFSTVKSRVVRLMTLLGAQNRAELIHIAYQRGFLAAPGSVELQAEISLLKVKLDGVSNDNRELFRRNQELQERVLEEQRKLVQQKELNRRIGGEALTWLDSGQGRL